MFGGRVVIRRQQEISSKEQAQKIVAIIGVTAAAIYSARTVLPAIGEAMDEMNKRAHYGVDNLFNVLKRNYDRKEIKEDEDEEE